MGVPQLKESCCGCSLQTGSKIIGWFHLVAGIVILILAGLQLSVGKHYNIQTPDGVLVIENPAYGYSIGLVVGILIGLVIATLLLCGAYNRTPGFALTWVIYNTVGSVLFIIGTLYGAGAMISAGYTGPGVGNLIGGLIAFGIQIYLILVVYSFYREMKNPPHNSAAYNTA